MEPLQPILSSNPIVDESQFSPKQWGLGFRVCTSDLPLIVLPPLTISYPFFLVCFFWGKISPNFDLKIYDFDLYKGFLMEKMVQIF